MRFWIKNTSGYPDAMLTFAVLAFIVVIVKVMLLGIAFTFNDQTINLGTIDAAVIAAMLTPTLGAYCARRHTERKYEHLDDALEAPVTTGEEK